MVFGTWSFGFGAEGDQAKGHVEKTGSSPANSYPYFEKILGFLST